MADPLDAQMAANEVNAPETEREGSSKAKRRNVCGDDFALGVKKRRHAPCFNFTHKTHNKYFYQQNKNISHQAFNLQLPLL